MTDSAYLMDPVEAVGMDAILRHARCDPKEIGQRIRARRKEQRMTLADLGRLLERAIPTVQQYEVGAEPRLAQLIELARHLQMNPFELICGIAAFPPPTPEQLAATTPSAAIRWDFGASGLEVEPKDVGRRIRKRRQEQGLSLATLGKLIGKSPPALQAYEVGASDPKVGQLFELSRHLAINPFYLISGIRARPSPDWEGEDIDMPDEDAMVTPDIDPESAEPKLRRSTRTLNGNRIPLFGNLTQSASEMARIGRPSEWSSADVVSHFACSKASLAFEIEDRRNAPQYHPGDLIVLDPQVRPVPGDMILARNKESVVFGRLRVNGDGTAEVLALNPDWPNVALRDFEPLVQPSLPVSLDAAQIVGVMTEHTARRRQ